MDEAPTIPLHGAQDPRLKALVLVELAGGPARFDRVGLRQ